MNQHELMVLSGGGNQELTNKISEYLDAPLGDIDVGSFSDGETRVELNCNVRGKDIFIVQPTCAPANHNIMVAMILADACRRSSAHRLTLVMPYFGYARQERKSAPRTPITAKLVADMIETAGFDRVLTMELHTGAIQGFFNIPVDHLYAMKIFSQYFKSKLDDPLVVSPDAGGVERARAVAKKLDCGIAIIDKRREKANTSEVMNIVGDVAEKNCIIVDDIIDTGGSLCKAAKALLENGAKTVDAAITHPVLSGPAVERIQNSDLRQLVVTDTIPLNQEAKDCQRIHQISVAELLAVAIRRIHDSKSISSLFS